jgi:hypothetical protein
VVNRVLKMYSASRHGTTIEVSVPLPPAAGKEAPAAPAIFERHIEG